MFSRYLDTRFSAPSRFNFDKGRSEFPITAWGSDQRKCDVLASQANQLLRMGRLDQRRNLPLESKNVISRYRKLAGIHKWGDEDDIGMSVLYAMKTWHRQGWDLNDKNYKIILYGEIEPNERDLLRTAAFLFRGIHIGLWLPRAVENKLAWDFNGENGDEWKPGSLGGILAYCHGYDQHGYEIVYGGSKIRVSNEFVEKFSDECWVCLESLDYWAQQVLDIPSLLMVRPSLIQYLERGDS
jgi:hypothetical protein